MVRNIPSLYGSSPQQSPRAIGAYLFWVAFATTCLTSSMFVTSQAPNLFATELARTITKVDVTWTSWMMGFLPVGVLLFVLTPLVTYVVYPPSIKNGSRVAEWAAMELRQMGRISRREITMAILAIVALLGWLFGSAFVAAVTVSLIVISLMLLTGVVSWNDILGNTTGWNVLIWFSMLLALANGLNDVGFIPVVREPERRAPVRDVPEMAAAVGIIALFFFVHYLFASTSAAYRGRAPGVPGRGRRLRQRARDARRRPDAALHRRHHGCADALRHRPGAGLVPRGLHRHARLLEAGVTVRSPVHRRPAADWISACVGGVETAWLGLRA